MTADAYRLYQPATRSTGVVFASPHSGRDYPEALLCRSGLDLRRLRSSEDAFVDDLFDSAPDAGAPLLAANWPRAWVDLNRSIDELDHALIEGQPRGGLNPRIASGLGVIPRVVANGQAIYRGKISRNEALERLRLVWQPYHARLGALIEESRRQFGIAVLVDCHSMPHEAIDGYAPRGGRPPEVVLGDRFGAAADSAIVERIEAILTDAGLRVARNTPFAGAYVAQQYGRPSLGQHVVQIELDRALYMDEARITPRADFPAFKRLIRQVTARIAEIGRPDGAEMPLAAE